MTQRNPSTLSGVYDGRRRGKHMFYLDPEHTWGGRAYGIAEFTPVGGTLEPGRRVQIRVSDEVYGRLQYQANIRARHRRRNPASGAQTFRFTVVVDIEAGSLATAYEDLRTKMNSALQGDWETVGEAWDSDGPVSPEDFERARMQAGWRRRNPSQIRRCKRT